ncbi:MAG TPA: creatininase [Lachnospiraceae bacterium]|nr:creatininase family protein [uncultured Lachnoclostridium sp.]HAU86882.1 creatininase [Lachnospiraceae bacterium]
MLRYEQMTYDEIEAQIKNRMLIIPAGSVEQHSKHLPLAVDSIISTKLSERLANEMDAIVAPTLSYGAISLSNSGGGMDYVQTIGIRGDILIGWYEQVIKGYVRAGAKKILILNAHWENEPFLIQAIELIKEQLPKDVVIAELSWWSLIGNNDMIRIFGQFSSWSEEHAAQAETALMMALEPSLVRKFCKDVKCLNQNMDIYTTRRNEAVFANHGSLGPYSHVTKSMAVQFEKLVESRMLEMVGEIQFNDRLYS